MTEKKKKRKTGKIPADIDPDSFYIQYLLAMDEGMAEAGMFLEMHRLAEEAEEAERKTEKQDPDDDLPF